MDRDELELVFEFMVSNYKGAVPRAAKDVNSVTWNRLVDHYNEVNGTNITLNKKDTLVIGSMCASWSWENVMDASAIKKMNEAVARGDIVVLVNGHLLDYETKAEQVFADQIEMYEKVYSPVNYIRLNLK